MFGLLLALNDVELEMFVCFLWSLIPIRNFCVDVYFILQELNIYFRVKD